MALYFSYNFIEFVLICKYKTTYATLNVFGVLELIKVYPVFEKNTEPILFVNLYKYNRYSKHLFRELHLGLYYYSKKRLKLKKIGGYHLCLTEINLT